MLISSTSLILMMALVIIHQPSISSGQMFHNESMVIEERSPALEEVAQCLVTWMSEGSNLAMEQTGVMGRTVVKVEELVEVAQCSVMWMSEGSSLAIEQTVVLGQTVVKVEESVEEVEVAQCSVMKQTKVMEETVFMEETVVMGHLSSDGQFCVKLEIQKGVLVKYW